MIALLIILFLLFMAVIGLLYVVFIQLTLKKNFKDEKWMDNSEFDYGHDVRYDYTEF